MSNYAVLENNVVVNIIIAEDDWIATQPNSESYIQYDETDNCSIGGDYIDGYFYYPQPYASWTRNLGEWLPPVPAPIEGKYEWHEETQSWVVPALPPPDDEELYEWNNSTRTWVRL